MRVAVENRPSQIKVQRHQLPQSKLCHKGSTRFFCTYPDLSTLPRIIMDFATRHQSHAQDSTAVNQANHAKVNRFLLVEEGTVIHVSGEKISKRGTPYKVGAFKDKNNAESTFLACSEKWDLELIDFLPGQVVNFDIEENGLKLKKLNLQPLLTQEHLMNCSSKSNSISKKTKNQTKTATAEKSGLTSPLEMIEQVASSLMQKAAEKGWPMCFGVLIPTNSFSKDEKD